MNLNKHFVLRWILTYFANMKGLVSIAFITLFYNGLQAQIQLIADPRIEQRVVANNSKLMPGYRVQLCFDSDKTLVDQARAQFVTDFPKIDTYVRFEAPNFNLMVGDFRTQKEAEELVECIRGRYPLTIVHKEQINLPRIYWFGQFANNAKALVKLFPALITQGNYWAGFIDVIVTICSVGNVADNRKIWIRLNQFYIFLRNR